MNIDEITRHRIGGFPQPGPAVREIGQQPSKPCDHDFAFLRNENIMRPDGVHPEGKCVGTQDVFYCRRCLEYREVKR